MADSPGLDHDEHARWAATAGQKRTTAEVLVGAERHADACLMFEQACQLALKAVLRGLGLHERHHDLDRLRKLVEEQTGGEGTPDDHYGADDTDGARTATDATFIWTEQCWRDLQEGTDEEGEG